MLQQQRRLLVLLGVALVALTGCFTGERPSLAPETSVDDEAVQTVLDRLDRADSLNFIATYNIIPSSTGDTTQATVVQLDGRRRVKIGDVEFITDGTVARTCRTDVEDCSDFLDDALVSNLNVTHAFWGPAFRTRLELDAVRRIGPSSGSTTTIAGQPAVCVDVIVPSIATSSGTVVYCALDAGILARYFGADVSIEMTSFSRDVAEAYVDS
jgi:hypothetical protein